MAAKNSQPERTKSDITIDSAAIRLSLVVMYTNIISVAEYSKPRKNPTLCEMPLSAEKPRISVHSICSRILRL
jgi:hypothetical protein